MNGPAKCAMYKLRPVFSLPDPVELPNNMYKLRKIDASGEPQVDIVRGILDKVKKILKSSLGDANDLEKRWDLVLLQLADLKLQLADIKKSVQVVASNTSSPVIASKSRVEVSNQLQALQGAVVRANPQSPPYSLVLLQRLYKEKLNLKISSHVHSSVLSLPDLNQFSSSIGASNGAQELNFTLIWKDGLLDTELAVNPIKQITILGEVNILRYLARLGLQNLNYNADELTLLQIDSILDISHRLLHVRTVKEKQSIIRNLNGKLGRNSYFGGNDINIGDIAVWSALKQTSLANDKDLGQSMWKWFARIESKLE